MILPWNQLEDGKAGGHNGTDPGASHQPPMCNFLQLPVRHLSASSSPCPFFLLLGPIFSLLGATSGAIPTTPLTQGSFPLMLFQEDHSHFLSSSQTRRFQPSSGYSRHKAEFGACLHALTLLDIVGWDDALTAHFVFGFVPVWVLERGTRHTLRPASLCRGAKPRGNPRRRKNGIGI